MERLQLVPGGLTALEHVEVGTKVVGLDKGVGHLDAFGLHGMLFGEVVVGDGVVVKVGDFLHRVSCVR